jgi:hypothetical protein
MPLIVPNVAQTVTGAVEGRPDRFTCFVVVSEKAAFPVTVTTAINFQTDPIFVQGFTRFMGFLSAVGVGSTLRIEYGICHPRTYVPLAYRTLFAAATPSPAMLASWGLGGQTVGGFQGDLATAFVVRLTAASGSVTINELILWFGW